MCIRDSYGIAQMNNTFTLSTKPDLKLTVTGFVHSKAIQDVYKRQVQIL